MEQNKKMKLDGLKVSSFITSLEESKLQTVNGGNETIISGKVKTLDPGDGSGYHTCYTHLATEGCSWDLRCTDGILCRPIIKM